MESLNRQKWEDLNLSRDELKSIGEALQKEEFRSLLLEYVKEINDPENRKQYEREIIQLENERGVDVKFVHPSPGYVLKTSVDGKSKAYINICSNSNVGSPSSTPDVAKGHQGLRWSIPYCLAPPREDVDKKSNSCVVYDVVFHPDTLHLTKSNGAFKGLVNDTAINAVEDNFHVSLDKVNVKFPKMQFKGSKHATVIRKKIENFKETEFIDIPNYPYPPLQNDVQHNLENVQSKHLSDRPLPEQDRYTTPKYVIKYRNIVDMQDYTNDPMSKMSISIPNEIVISIDLPLLKFSTDASIDVTENSLLLICEKPVKYKLKVNLPYVVDNNGGNAKFDVVKKVLTVTLPVVKQKFYQMVDLAREDSGVESDNCAGKSNSISSGDEDGVENELLKDKSENKPQVDIITAEKFLKSDIHYTLPNLKCQLLNDIFMVTILVPNVNPESVEYRFLIKSSGFHLNFTSIGSGFFPVHYTMCLVLPCDSKIENETLNVEVWDNNVIAQVKLISGDVHLSYYYIGIDESSVKKFSLPDPVEVENSTIEQVTETVEQFKPVDCNENGLSGKDLISTVCEENNGLKVPSFENEAVHSIDGRACENSLCAESQAQPESEKGVSSKDRENGDILPEEDKDLSISESGSSFDESTSSPHRQPAKSRSCSESQEGEIMRNKNRGILKIGRSLSESSVDDYASWSSEKIEKTKKTVRFSDVISKQTFRMNSSILGQRKKNQRKMKNKKRAQERRFSESGGESEGESDAGLMREKISGGRKEIDVWFKEVESSSCEASEVSEVSDISESDDGQKEEVKPSMPCSSKKNHRRRGKKSARKNAATAKLQFMEN